jgi:hypothetical protein
MGCTTEAVPNEKRSLEQFEELLESTNMAQVLLPFTEEQLITLSQYPKVSLDYANKLITKDLHSGKTIHHQFNYFVSIVKSHLEKNPQTGKSGATQSRPRPSTFSPYVEGGKWIPGARVINNERNYQTTITYVETDEEFALNYEKQIHRLTQMTQEELDDAYPKLKGITMKQRAKFDRCPIWSKFTPQQQATIWNLAHGSSCKCRRNEDAGMIMPDIAQKLADKIPVAQMTMLEQEYLDPSIFEEVL